MIDAATATHEDFARFIGEEFHIAGGGQSELLRLMEARVLGQGWRDAQRDPFSLQFLGAPGLRLRQGTYRFEHPQLGEMPIFITQLGSAASGSTFEAVFN